MWLMEESILRDHDEQDGGLQAMAFRKGRMSLHGSTISSRQLNATHLNLYFNSSHIDS